MKTKFFNKIAFYLFVWTQLDASGQQTRWSILEIVISELLFTYRNTIKDVVLLLNGFHELRGHYLFGKKIYLVF
jgi:hypothetical protein